jgi:hypothetical protein
MTLLPAGVKVHLVFPRLSGASVLWALRLEPLEPFPLASPASLGFAAEAVRTALA